MEEEEADERVVSLDASPQVHRPATICSPESASRARELIQMGAAAAAAS